ncbi:MAG: metal ABC transporter permease, partial [Microcystaceae cyanobacterium]
MLEALQFEFMRNALLAGILVSLSCGIIGSLVVVNRMVFISGGVAHAAYGGIGIAYFLRQNPVVGAIVFSIFSAMGMGWLQRRMKERADTLIGVLWAVGMAIGIIFLDLTPGYKTDLMSYLFGSILAVPQGDLWLMAAIDVMIMGFVIGFYKPLLAL